MNRVITDDGEELSYRHVPAWQRTPAFNSNNNHRSTISATSIKREPPRPRASTSSSGLAGFYSPGWGRDSIDDNTPLATRGNPDIYTGHCAYCKGDPQLVMRLACEHSICQPCFNTLLSTSIRRGSSSITVVCSYCAASIEPERFLPNVTENLQGEYVDWRLEREVPPEQRFRCNKIHCRAFIHPSAIGPTAAFCKKCQTVTPVPAKKEPIYR